MNSNKKIYKSVKYMSYEAVKGSILQKLNFFKFLPIEELTNQPYALFCLETAYELEDLIKSVFDLIDEA